MRLLWWYKLYCLSVMTASFVMVSWAMVVSSSYGYLYTIDFNSVGEWVLEIVIAFSCAPGVLLLFFDHIKPERTIKLEASTT